MLKELVTKNTTLHILRCDKYYCVAHSNMNKALRLEIVIVLTVPFCNLNVNRNVLGIL